MMDPLLNAYGTEGYRERDPSIRFVEERDIPAIADLFRMNYGEEYISPDVYDGTWVKRSIHSDHIICLVLEANERVMATGSVVLNYGDYNDKSGELARLVSAGFGFGRRVAEALLKVASNTLEFAFGECRTAHTFSQKMFEEAGFVLVGFAPQYLQVQNTRESFALYARLYGDGKSLRSSNTPAVIREVAPLTSAVLLAMGLSENFDVIDPEISRDSDSYSVRAIDRDAVSPLLRIPHGRVINPLLFGNISVEQGLTFIRDKAHYLVAFDQQQNPVGTIGYHFDETNRLIKGIELIAESSDVWPTLCHALIQAAEDHGAEVLSVDVSAYQPKLQRLLYDLGFRPVAYAPAMVFHQTERLDVIKMVKLNVAYDPGEMRLTEAAQRMVSLVEASFRIR